MDQGIDTLPYMERKQLCAIINVNNAWMELALAMQFQRECELNIVTNADSPADKLLDIWGGKYGHTVMELFTLLYQNHMHAAMHVLRPFVDKKYHKLIKAEQQHTELKHQEEQELRVDNEETTRTRRDGDTRDNNRSKLTIGGVVESAGSIPQVHYDELEACTQKWSQQFLLGRGGYATVFKGIWKKTIVAIKRIEAKRDNSGAHQEQIRQSISELKYLNAYRHENILPIYAYSIGGPYPCLVYQFMANGALDKRLHTTDPSKYLSWHCRLDIAIGTARGLQYLHTLSDKPLIHVDIKPANILLDANDVPKIGDFGLARIGPDPSQADVEVSRTFGTLPYLPFEFLVTKKLTTKIDVYSFGVVLFELATGLSVMTENRSHRLLKDHVVKFPGHMLQLKDQRVQGGEKIFVFLLTYGKACVDAQAGNRPEMVTMLEELEKIPRESETTIEK